MIYRLEGPKAPLMAGLLVHHLLGLMSVMQDACRQEGAGELVDDVVLNCLLVGMAV